MYMHCFRNEEEVQVDVITLMKNDNFSDISVTKFNKFIQY